MKNTLITLIFVSLHFAASAQDYYWVGGTGNWSDYTNHWATSSGGSTFHTSAPSTSNDVYFDANSFTSTGQTVTLDAEAYCLSMDWTGAANFPALSATGFELTIAGSLTLVADMTVSFGTINFTSSSAGEEITSNGTEFGSSGKLIFNGSGSWTLQDNLDAMWVEVSSGSFNTNSNDITLSSRFTTSGSSTKTISFGSSEITSPYFFINGSNQTIDAGTSKIYVKSFAGDQYDSGPYTFYDVEFYTNGFLRNDGTFHEITFAEGIDMSIGSNATFTVSSLVSKGTLTNPVILEASTSGSEATFSSASGTISLEYVELQDIHASGGASFVATNSVDNGNNTGWTITTTSSLDYYWIGDEGEWSDVSHWATTSGGSTTYSSAPSQYDNVYFDENSFTQSDQIVTLTEESFCKSIDCQDVLYTPEIKASYGNTLNIYGSANFTGVDQGIYTIHFYGSDTHTVNFGSSGVITIPAFYGSGSYIFESDLSSAIHLKIYAGEIDFNDNDVTATNLEISGSSTVVNMGSGSHTLSNLTYSSGSFNAETSTITIQSTIENSSSTSLSLYDLTLDGTVSVTGSSIIENLSISEGATITLESGETTTVIGNLTLEGSNSNPISLAASASGSQTTISKASGSVDGNYLVLQDVEATGGATFNANNSVDNGNNTGWNITAAVKSDYYWVGDGGDWSDYANHWATSSGGSTFHTQSPGVSDVVVFDANSFSTSGEVVTIDITSASCGDFTAAEVDESFTISGTGKSMSFYGSLALSELLSIDVASFNFVSTEEETLDFQNGPGSDCAINFTSSGSYTLLSALTSSDITQEGGTINTAGYTVSAGELSFEGDDEKEINLSTSLVSATSLITDYGTNLIFNGGSSELELSGSISLEDDSSEEITLNDISIHGSVSFYGNISTNTFTIEAGTTLTHVGESSIETNELIAIGTESEVITISPQMEDATLTISQSAGTVEAYYLELENITATGGATFLASNSLDNGNVIGWTFSRESQSITFEEVADKAYGDEPFELVATASSGLAVSFEILSGPATLDGSTLTITAGGTVRVIASQAGNGEYDPAASVTQEFEVAKIEQQITMENPGALTYLDDITTTLSATGGDSGNEIIFSSSDIIIFPITDQTATILGAGEVTITATQAGNDYYEEATAELTITIAKADQVVSFSNPGNQSYGSDPFTLTAYSSSTGEVTFTSSDESILTIDGNTATILAVGEVTITATQAGTSNYHEASAERTITIVKADQVVTFNDLGSLSYGDDPMQLVATSTSGEEVTFTSSDESILSIAGNTATILATGEVSITATQAGTDNYNGASAEQTISIEKGDQQIVFDELGAFTFGDEPITISATGGGSGMDVSFSSSDENILSITGSTATILGAGEVTITAMQEGSENYKAASAELALTIAKADQSITFQDLGILTFGDDPVAIAASGGASGGVLSFSSSDESILSIAGSTATILGAGEVTITATQAGDENYKEATEEMTFTIAKAQQEIAFAEIEDFELNLGSEAIVLSAEATSGLAVSYTVDGPATLSGNELSPSGPGTVTVTASQAGSDNYLAAEDVIRTFVVTEGTAVLGLSEEQILSIYPNPTTTHLQVSKSNATGELLVVIYSLQGEKVLSHNGATGVIDVSSLRNGAYVVQIFEQSQRVYTNRLIIQK